MKKMQTNGRQGDVNIIRFDYLHLLTGIMKRKNNIIATGEESHDHTLNGNGSVLDIGLGTALQINTISKIEHKPVDNTTHKPFEIPEGFFIINQQVQYNPFTEVLEKVQD